MASDIMIHERKKMDLENGMLVVGFPTIGLVGTIAAHHLMSTMKLQHIGSIYSKDFQPTAVVHDYIPAPPVNIFAGEEKCGPEGTCDQIIIVESEFLPAPGTLKPLGDALIEWSDKRKITLTTVLEGMVQIKPEDDVHIFGVGSTKHARDVLDKYKIQKLEQGMVSGISGVMLYEGERLDKDVVCLLAETHIDYPDERGDAELLTTLNHLLPQMEIDPEPLLEQAEKIEKRIRESIRQATPPESKVPDLPFPMYR